MYPHPREQRDSHTHLVPNGIVISGTPNKQAISPQKEDEKHQQKPSSRKVKRSVFLWTNSEVMRWLRKKHIQYYSLYNHVFKDHDISGKSLVRLNHIKLEKMGITDLDHRSDLLEHILRLKLKHELHELKLLQKVEPEHQHQQ
ncbi:protein aveugle-like [Amphiura filiformis]|uniref:protein aveugle-like n=1 Tax=Amphiura filiformis TaxID=82378 RepID=UPI003B2224C3